MNILEFFLFKYKIFRELQTYTPFLMSLMLIFVSKLMENGLHYFGSNDLAIEWKNSGLDEIGIDKNTGKVIVAVDKKYFRPSEVDILLGDSSKAMKKLGWIPKVKFKELIKIMVQEDMRMLKEKDERF